MDAKEFGSYLRQLRNKKNLTLTELGDLIGYSNPYLSQIETGKKGIPSPDILKKLSVSLEVDYGTLMYKAGYLDDGSLIVAGKLADPRDAIEKLIKSAANGVIVDGVTLSQEEALDRWKEQSKKTEFGIFIRELREKRGLTLVNLSNISGIPQDQLSELESGTSSRNRPKPWIISKLSLFLGQKYKDEMLRKAGYDVTSSEEYEFNSDDIADNQLALDGLRKIMNMAAHDSLDNFLDKPSIYYKGIELTEVDKERIHGYVEGLFAGRLSAVRKF